MNPGSIARGVVLTGALILAAACGDVKQAVIAEPAKSGASSTATAAGADPKVISTADALFADEMNGHYQWMVRMADLAVARATSAEVRDLAARIRTEHDPEIQAMRRWLVLCGWSTDPDSSMGFGAFLLSIREKRLDRLKAAKDVDFDRVFTKLMIEHQRHAIDSARRKLADGGDPEVRRIVKTIETRHEADVKRLRELLDRL